MIWGVRNRPAESLGSWHRNASLPPLLPPHRSHTTLSFRNVCPFTIMRLHNLPNPQRYTRQERYWAQPPRVLEPSGFHTENSLALYQGLVYYLLWLHSKYDKVGVWRLGGCPRPGLVRDRTAEAQKARPERLEKRLRRVEQQTRLDESGRWGRGLEQGSGKWLCGCGRWAESRRAQGLGWALG